MGKKQNMFMAMVVYDTLFNLWNTLEAYSLNIFFAVVLLIIGWVIGLAVGRISKEIIKRLKLDNYLARGGKPLFKLSSILPLIFSWFIYLAFIQASVEALGIATLVTIVGTVIAFLPGLAGAIIVTLAGYAIAEYVRNQVEQSGYNYSDLIGQVLFFFIIYVAIATALPLINIPTTLINNVLLIVVGSVGAGMALALGLGLKDTVAEMARKYKGRAVRKKKK